MKSYYSQIAPIALEYLQLYIKDVTKHDRRGLKGFTGEFIYAMRVTGTNLLKFGGDNKPDSKFDEIVECFLFQSNDRFFHGKDGAIDEITEGQAINIYDTAKMNGVKFYN